MLKELNEYITESGSFNDISQYDDTKYIQLPEELRQQFVDAMNNGEVPMRKASECPAKRLLLHFLKKISCDQKDFLIQYYLSTATHKMMMPSMMFI